MPGIDIDFVIIAHQRAQSSFASRFTAGVAGFLILSQMRGVSLQHSTVLASVLGSQSTYS